MRASPLDFFENWESFRGSNSSPAPLAYNNGPRLEKTTATQKNRMAPKLQVYRAREGV
jgi:hypothetical protein